LFGSHLSIAGSMTNALTEAQRLRMDTVQVFTKNQRQWKAPPLSPLAVSEWTAQLRALGWQGRTTAHASYLINLASPDDELWTKSIALMLVEIERCEALSIPFLVHHPGSTTGHPGGAGGWGGAAYGIARITEAYRLLFRSTRGFRTVSCLENTVGAGSTLGGPFEQLAALRARIIEATGDETRIGFCFDTCHAHAAGHDMGGEGGAAAAAATLDAWDSTCGLAHIRVLHLNDSKGKRGSHLDRHEHIGQGTIGKPRLSASGFATVVNHPALRGVPKILETPKGKSPGGVDFDTLNLRRLRKLVTPADPIRTHPSPTPSLPPVTLRPRSRTPRPART
jgi:deoxyribonuclease IV